MRLKKAKELPAQTSLPVQTIVEMVGYNDPCYFSKVFRKATGQSPGSYRKTIFAVDHEKASPVEPLRLPTHVRSCAISESNLGRLEG